MTRYAALLRAVNVGGRNKVPMADLRTALADLGYTDVATYVQSGNAVFTATKRPDEAALGAALGRRFGFPIDVMVRDRDQLAAVVAHGHPFAAPTIELAKLHVVFLAGAPIKQPKPAPPDRFAIATIADAHHIFVHYADGAGATKLRLDCGVPGTARNWRSLVEILALADAVATAPAARRARSASPPRTAAAPSPPRRSAPGTRPGSRSTAKRAR